jgi:hypothetical protein
METEYKLDTTPRRRTSIGVIGTFATIGGFVCETLARLASFAGVELPLGWIDGVWLGSGLGIAWALTRR